MANLQETMGFTMVFTMVFSFDHGFYLGFIEVAGPPSFPPFPDRRRTGPWRNSTPR
jgi:hypothetical protein